MNDWFKVDTKAGDKTKEQANPAPIPSWGRPFAIITAIVFVISSMFPMVAALSKDTASFPAWWGMLDVGIAFILAIMAFVIYGLAHSRVNRQVEETTYRAYRLLIHGIFVLTAVFLLFGDQIVWINGLPGIAWRAWLASYVLPEWLGCIGIALGNSGQGINVKNDKHTKTRRG